MRMITIPLLLLAALPALGQRVMDKKFVALTVMQFGAATADIETTQHCLENRTCVEANPLMPSSRAGMYAVDFGIAAGETWASYLLRKHGHREWVVAPLVGIASHGIAIGLTVTR